MDHHHKPLRSESAASNRSLDDISETNTELIAAPTARLLVSMVGLPARGKTYVARKVARYLNWLNHTSQIFNVGSYRRKLAGSSELTHAFFDNNDADATRLREEIADRALTDAIQWVLDGNSSKPTPSTTDQAGYDANGSTSQAGGSTVNVVGGGMEESIGRKSVKMPPPKIATHQQADVMSPITVGRKGIQRSQVRTARVALYDATNSTVARRKMIMERCQQSGVPVMFVEMVCNKPEIITANIKDVKLLSPDYQGIDPDVATQDFISRIKHYEENYETISEAEGPPESPISFVKIVDVGDRVIVQHVKGHIQSRIVYFLMNLNITPRCIYFSRHGESVYNVLGKIGGDADLSERGFEYAQKLPAVIKQHMEQKGTSKLTVWTSTLRRTIQTAAWIPHPQLQWKALDELDSGVCDGLTYEEIEEKYPEDFAERDNDKYNYRYRGGESYADLVRRLEPVTLELERHHEKNHAILIIGHQAVLRALYAYFLNYSHDELPYLKIPLHTVVKLELKAYGCIEERFKVDVDAVDTHRLPKNSPAKAMFPELPPAPSEAIKAEDVDAE